MVGRPTQLGSIGGKTADIKYAKQNTVVYQATPIFLINGITLQPAPPPAYRATCNIMPTWPQPYASSL